DGRPRGRVAMYAWGDDYHDVIRAKLWGIVDRLRSDVTQSFDVRVCVDTAPLVERELAARAGIGWIGKNTMVLNAGLGSYFFLGAIVTTLALTPDDPLPDHCGSCTACLEACPTAAFPAAYQMDASRCISYLTIEHRESISLGFQEKMVNWVFGCDVCQEVCPFNRDAPHTQEPRFAIRPPGPAPVLDDILRWSAEDYRRELRGSAVKRAKPDMLRRNARIAKKNALKD
ncbi:MAG: tRNA epoxyqueuosine(34) reductase QueG, partial [Phycisphaerae bacterium]